MTSMTNELFNDPMTINDFNDLMTIPMTIKLQFEKYLSLIKEIRYVPKHCNYN
jgi:hypothetical protein